MNILRQTVLCLKKEEIRHFKLSAGVYKSIEERKESALLDLIRNRKEAYDEEEASVTLFGENDKNNFYRLKHRLVQMINLSFWSLNREEDPMSESLFYFSLARLYYKRKEKDLAVHYLKKSEKIAQIHESYEVLDMIYRQWIQVAIETATFSPEPYIHLRKENNKILDMIQEIDDALALIIHKINSSLNVASDHDLLNQLEEKVTLFTASFEISTRKKWRFKVYDALIRLLLQKNDYLIMEKYLLETYPVFLREGLFTKDNHDDKLKMLTYIINTLNRNGKYKESLIYTEKLLKVMHEFQDFLYEKYLFFYYNSLVINYFTTERSKALEILLKMKQLSLEKPQAAAGFNLISVYLNLALLTFDRKEFSKSLKYLNELFSMDTYKKADSVLKMKIDIFEVIVIWEFDVTELSEKKIQKIRRDYPFITENPEWAYDKLFLELMESVLKTGENNLDQPVFQHFRKEGTAQIHPSHQIFDYNDWIEKRFFDKK